MQEEETLEEYDNRDFFKELDGTFFQPPGSEFEFPSFKRLFARVDQIEPHLPGEDSRLVSFDCINADYLEEIGFDSRPLHISDDPRADENLAIVSAVFSKERTKELQNAGWVFLEIIYNSTENNASYSQTLFGDPIAVQLIERPLHDLMIERELNRIAGWDDIKASKKKDVHRTINSVPTVDGAVVYDVGQGNCVALLNADSTVAFFDVGSSVMGNKRSFPNVTPSICADNEAVVILSHWDWDHWSFALRDATLTTARWIVPIQRKSGPLGLVHSRFVATLRKLNTSIQWVGSKFGSVNYSNGITLVKSNFNKKNRNKSGLIVGVGKTDLGHKLLLPGDGVLEELNPGGSGWATDFIVVPHHGGKTRLKCFPEPERVTRSSLIYSYGVGNIFLHPMLKTLMFWRGTKWRKNYHTSLRDSDGLGSIGIDFTKKRSYDDSACDKRFCPTRVKQWLR